MKQFKKSQVFNDGDGRPRFDKEFAKQIIGKTVIVGKTYQYPDGRIDGYEQKYGIVIEANDEGVGIRLHNSEDIFWLPPDLRSWEPLRPETYTLQSTNEEILNPDYLSTWIVDLND